MSVSRGGRAVLWREMRRSAPLLSLAVVLAACGAPAVPVAPAADWRSFDCDSAIGSPAGASDQPGFSTGSWKTDFSRRCVPLSEILAGGPGPDGIPPIDEPRFVSAAEAESWLAPNEPVMAVEERGDARAYPLQILMWHEIVNDTIGDRPVAVTYCPLCNAALVFDRRLDGRELTFGTTGMLRRSDLVMWDRQTQSWWQQVTGEAIVGELTARKLARVDSLVLSFSEFRRSHPGGRVLSRDAAGDEARRKTGSGRDYGRNPYTGYDRAATGPVDAFWAGPALDGRLEPKARVAVARGARPVAYPLDGLGPAAAANETFEGRPIVLLYARGAASALDTARIRDGADVGQAGLFERTLDGRVLTFRASGRALLDVETGSEWTVAGVAMSGPLRGSRLRPIEHEVTFWFIWAVFRPDTEVRRVGT